MFPITPNYTKILAFFNSWGILMTDLHQNLKSPHLLALRIRIFSRSKNSLIQNFSCVSSTFQHLRAFPPMGIYVIFTFPLYFPIQINSKGKPTAFSWQYFYKYFSWNHSLSERIHFLTLLIHSFVQSLPLYKSNLLLVIVYTDSSLSF